MTIVSSRSMSMMSSVSMSRGGGGHLFFPTSARGRLRCRRRGWCALACASWAVIQPLWSFPELHEDCELGATDSICPSRGEPEAYELSCFDTKALSAESCCSNELLSACKLPAALRSPCAD